MIPPTPQSTWSDEVRRLYDHDVQEIWDRSIAPHIWNQYHAQLDLYLRIADRLQPRTILDVGCAQATLALLLAERGYKVCANDLRDEFLTYARSRYERGDIQFLCGNVFELQLEHPFDLVFANQIIEHLVYPVDFLTKLRSLVNPGGYAFVSTPNHSYIRNPLPTHTELGDPSQYEDRQFTADGDGHFFAYTTRELSAYAVAAGFAVKSCFCFETPWISGHVKVRHVHPYCPQPVLKGLDWFTRQLPIIGKRLCHQSAILVQNLN